MPKKPFKGYAIQHNDIPWNIAGFWRTMAVCDYKGEACLMAKLFVDHQSAGRYHDGEETRVINLDTGAIEAFYASGELKKIDYPSVK